jgi:hypothetical protein
MDTKELTNKVLSKLKRKGMVCRLVGLSDHGSFYIHLKGNSSGIRISNHRENDGLCYLYNIRTDVVKYFEFEGRYYFPASEAGRAVNFITKNEAIKY